MRYDVGAGAARPLGERPARAAADRDRPHRPVRVARRAHAPGVAGSTRGRDAGELAQRRRRRQLARPARCHARPAVGSLREQIEGGLLVRVRRPQRGRHRRRASRAARPSRPAPRRPLDIADRAGAGRAPAAAGTCRCPSASTRTARSRRSGPAPAAASASTRHGGRSADGTNTTSLSSGVDRRGSSGRRFAEPEPVGERVGHSGIGDVGVGVRDEVRDAGADHPVDQRALRVVGRHAVHGGQQQRVMRDSSSAPTLIASATVAGTASTASST